MVGGSGCCRKCTEISCIDSAFQIPIETYGASSDANCGRISRLPFGGTPFLVSDIVHSPFKNTITFLFTAALVLVISQSGSYLVNANVAIGETHVVNAFLFITHIRNVGGTFGAFPGHSVIFAVISSAILVACTVFFFKSQPTKWTQFLLFGFIVGGGVSNVLDRVLRGSVVDFINLQGIPHWNYIFNTADVFIHLGIWPSLLLSILIARREKRMGTGA